MKADTSSAPFLFFLMHLCQVAVENKIKMVKIHEVLFSLKPKKSKI